MAIQRSSAVWLTPSRRAVVARVTVGPAISSRSARTAAISLLAEMSAPHGAASPGLDQALSLRNRLHETILPRM